MFAKLVLFGWLLASLIGCAPTQHSPTISTTAAVQHSFPEPGQTSIVISTMSVFTGKATAPMLSEQQLVADARDAASSKGFTVLEWSDARQSPPTCDYILFVSERVTYRDYESIATVATPTYSSGSRYNWGSGSTTTYSGSSTTYNSIPVTRTLVMHFMSISAVPRDRWLNDESGTSMDSMAIWTAMWSTRGEQEKAGPLVMWQMLDRWGKSVDEEVPLEQGPGAGHS